MLVFTPSDRLPELSCKVYGGKIELVCIFSRLCRSCTVLSHGSCAELQVVRKIKCSIKVQMLLQYSAEVFVLSYFPSPNFMAFLYCAVWKHEVVNGQTLANGSRSLAAYVPLAGLCCSGGRNHKGVQFAKR